MNNYELTWYIRIMIIILALMVIIALIGNMVMTGMLYPTFVLYITLFAIIIILICKTDSLMGVMAIFTVMLCGGIIIQCDAKINNINMNTITSENILSIDYTNNTSDVFHIGFDNKYYYVFKKDDTGAIELMKLPCDVTKLKEVNTPVKPTYNYKKNGYNMITDKEIIVTKGKYKLITR